MASNDTELIAEVRSLVGYGETVIPNVEFQSLIDIAKRDLVLELDGTAPADWYNDGSAETALFYSVCLFSKIRTGEIGGVQYAVAELEKRPLPETELFWLKRVEKALASLKSEEDRNSGFAHSTISRTDRVYGDN
mgnify:FL=1